MIRGYGGGGSSAANETDTAGGAGGGTNNGQFNINGQGGNRGIRDSEGSNANIIQGGETYWGDNAYGLSLIHI